MRNLFTVSLAALLAGTLARAADTDYSRERSVSDGSSSGQPAGQMPGEVDHSKSQQQAGAPMSDQAKKVAQQDLAPHSLMMETQLKGALTDLQGLKAELKVNEDLKQAPSSAFISHFKMLGKEINDDLKMVKTHEKELQGGVKKHPDIAKTEDFKAIVPTLNELYSLNSSWQAKANTSGYWKDTQAVKSDLDKFENRLNTAIDKTKGFNSSQLDLSSVG